MAYAKKTFKKRAYVAPVRPTSNEIDTRVYNNYQSTYFGVVANSVENFIMEALAGTGKTTTLVKGLSYVPKGKSCLMIAFNKAIADELNARIPSDLDVECMTAHAYGMRQFNATYVGKKEVMKSNYYLYCKTYAVIEDLEIAIEGAVETNIVHICKIVSHMKSQLVDSEEGIMDILNRFKININKEQLPKVIDVCIQAYKHSQEITSHIDFDDMVAMPVQLNIPCKKYDYIFVDEAQDLNPAQIELIAKAMKPDSRIFFVGDSNQAIYGFRGATKGAMSLMKERFNCKTLSLPITYRCPKKVVELAQEFVPEYEAHESAPDGVVNEIEIASLVELAEPGCFVISRTNAPLVKILFKMIQAEKKAIIKDRDFGESLASIVKPFKGDFSNIVEFIEKWEANSRASAISHNPKADTETIEDKAECLRIIANGCTSLKEMIANIKDMFDDTDSTTIVTLTTTHKAKGLEREIVYVLRDTFMKRKSGAEVDDEEKNLYYVAITRTKYELNLVAGKL